MVSSAFHLTTFLLSGLAFLHRSEVRAACLLLHNLLWSARLAYLESIIFLAASAYLNSSFRASSLYLMRDNLGYTGIHFTMQSIPVTCSSLQEQTDTHLMGMSFITSRNMDGEMTGSQSLGSKGSWPLSITFLSSSQRLNDSRGGSIPEPQATYDHVKVQRTWAALQQVLYGLSSS